MKIRTGFVSNSSSSSFLVLLDERPKDVNHLRKLIFSHTVFSSKGDFKEVYEEIHDPYLSHSDDLVEGKDFFTTKAAAKYLGVPKEERVCLVSQDNKKNMIKFIADSLMFVNIEDKLLAVGYPPYPKATYGIRTPEESKESNKKWIEFHKLEKKWARTYAKFLAEMLIQQDTGKYLCKFRASDNDSAIGSTVEHGDTFKNCSFWLRFSQH